jgi:sugar lactone lactonase YvrE
MVSGLPAYSVQVDWEQLPSEFSHRDVSGIAVDSADRVYVFNRSEHPIQIHEADGSFVGSWGEGVFTNPHGIRVVNDVVFCVDDFDHTLRKFSLGGELLQVWGTPGIPSDTGYRDDDYRSVRQVGPPFNRPTNCAVDPSGVVFVTDGYGNARVHRFSPEGKLELSWGEPGSGPGQFNVPHSVAVDAAGRLLVADRENDRIQLFDRDGKYIDQWKDLARPNDIAFDALGNVYVAELGPAGPYAFQEPFPPSFPPSRVSILSPDGEVLDRWGTRDCTAAGSFYAAHGICIDSHGDVYVGEVVWSAGGGSAPPGCHTLQKFVRSAT